MPKFKDKKGNEWELNLDLETAERIDDSDFSKLTTEKFSILEPGKELFNLMISKTRVMFAVIFAMVKPQVAKVTGLDPDTDGEKAQRAFVALMDGTAVENARKAFFEALADFFPDQRTVLSKLLIQWAKGRAILEGEIQGMEEDMDLFLKDEIQGKTRIFKEALKEKDPAKRKLKLQELEVGVN